MKHSEEPESILHRQWEERQVEGRRAGRLLRAKLRTEATYGRLLSRSWELILTHLLEASDCLWRGLENCGRLMIRRGRQ